MTAMRFTVESRERRGRGGETSVTNRIVGVTKMNQVTSGTNIMSGKKKTEKLEIGIDIALLKGEKLFTFKTKMGGEVYYSTSRYESVFIEGTEFLTVFPKPRNKNDRRTMLMRADALERVRV
jgi:hypothetical protein